MKTFVISMNKLFKYRIYRCIQIYTIFVSTNNFT